VALTSLVLKDRIPNDRLSAFSNFLEQTSHYSHITLDQWCSFLEFCLECEDLSTYDEVNSAWPVLIDEFVEYMEEQDKSGKR
jgi:Cullin binding